MVRVALVGYTNVGKSSLMNLITKSEVLVENKLFATLDTTVRKMVLANDQGKTVQFLLSDTVGFIRKLPHHLVECFKSTLDEVREADILLHVVDISHSGFEEQITVVKRTLQELGAADKPTLMVFNKIDAYDPDFREPETVDDEVGPFTLEQLEQSWMSKESKPIIFVSVKEKTNIDTLRDMLFDAVTLVTSTQENDINRR